MANTLCPGDTKDLYFRLLMYGYLTALCSERITMNLVAKRTPLLLENSLRCGKTATARLFQKYAQSHRYPLKFPSHLGQAADFFRVKVSL